MLTPEEISSRQFLISLRGYDRGEVEGFLREVAEEVGALRARIRELEGRLARTSGRPGEQASVPARSGAAAHSESGAHPFQALGEETTRILVAAEESAQEIRRRAEDRARHDVEQARREARDEVSGARRTASKIVADAERRRNGVAEDIRELESARDELMNDLRTVMQTLQSTVRGLASASEATELGTSEDIEVEGPGPALAAGEASEEQETRPGGGESATSPQRPGYGAPPDTQPARDGDEDRKLENAKRAVAPDGLDEEDGVVADLEHVDPSSTTEAALEEDREDVDAMASAVAAAPDTNDIDVDEAVAVAAGGTTAADAGREEEAADRAADDPDSVDQDEHDDDEVAGAAAVAVDGQAAIQLRVDSLSGIRPGMLRRLKRALQDVQNGVLDAIRRAEGGGDVDDLLPVGDELDPMADVASMFLSAAYRAGVADGASLADVEAPEEVGDGSRVSASSNRLETVLSHEIKASLTATLRAGLEAGEPETSLSERVGGVFRDLKGPVLETAVDEHLTRIYGFGAIDLWRELDVTDKKRWVAGDEPRCPANQCRTNETEGPVSLGDEFPSGDAVPPAHDACVCAVVPA